LRLLFVVLVLLLDRSLLVERLGDRDGLGVALAVGLLVGVDLGELLGELVGVDLLNEPLRVRPPELRA
jgi:hypothetical protein